MNLLKLIFFMLLFVSNSFANTYFIDWAGGNDSNSGTDNAHAWKHAPGDASAGGSVPATLVAGDTLVFKGGVTYQGFTPSHTTCSNVGGLTHGAVLWAVSSGSSGNPITYISGDIYSTPWGTGKAILDGQTTANAVKWGILLGSKSFITIQGFEIKNVGAGGAANSGAANYSGGAGIEVDCSANASIQFNLIHDINWSSSYVQSYGIENNDSSNMLAEKNEIYHTTDKLIETSSSNNSSPGYTDTAPNAIIRYNYLHEGGGHCIVLSSTTAQVYNNLIWECATTATGSGFPNPGYCLKVDQGKSNKIWNNVCYRASAGWGVLNGTSNVFVHNIAFGIGFQGSGLHGSQDEAGLVLNNNDNAWGAAGVNGNQMLNNIIYYINTPNTAANPKVVYFNQDGGSNNLVENNIFMASSGDTTSTTNRVRYNSGANDNATISNSYLTIAQFNSNFGADFGGSGNVASGNIVVDPAFPGGTFGSFSPQPTGFNASYTDFNQTSYHFTGASPAAITGITVASPMNVDVTGVTRSAFWPGVYDANGSVVNALIHLIGAGGLIGPSGMIGR